jgi:hypothetical protein
MVNHLPIVLIGNALSLMVAATRLARNGTDVAIINSGKNWGGHFTTVTCKGVAFDAGMVLHEFTSYNAKNGREDPQTYDAAVRNDAGRFCETVRDYIAGYQVTHDIKVPSMYVDNGIRDDILVANALSSLPKLSYAGAIEMELAALVTLGKSALHASRKHRSDAFKTTDYRSASLANHGATFHANLIEPFCQKLLNAPTLDVVALYHRVAWLPLFYPETLLSYVRGVSQKLPATIFSYPFGECVGNLANKLKSEIEQNDRITIMADRPTSMKVDDLGRVELSFANQDTIVSEQTAWANVPGDLLRLLGREQDVATYQKCSIALAFIRIRTGALRLDFTVLNVVDPRIAIYRVTNQSRCAGVDSDFANIVVEFNPDYARATFVNVAHQETNDRIGADLVALGLVSDVADVEFLDVKQLNNALMLPSKPNRQACEHELDVLKAVAPTISRLGPASGFFSSSFNDQIVQGLKLAAQWE